MSNEISKQSTPEEIELEAKRRELASLEEQVSERELELATSRAKLHRFEATYLQEVGIYLTELDELTAQVAEKLAAKSPGDEAAQAEAKEAREQAEESYGATENLDEDAHAENSFEPSAEFQSLYRMAARKFHPDTTTDENERKERKKIMAEINRLYAEGKEDELRESVERYSKRPEAVEGQGIAFELVRAIRKIDQLRQRLVAIEKELGELHESHLFELFRQITEAKKEGRDLLRDMQASLKAEIQDTKEQLATLG
jgi:hypothetical protein